MPDSGSTGGPSLRQSLGLEQHPLTRAKFFALGAAILMMLVGVVITANVAILASAPAMNAAPKPDTNIVAAAFRHLVKGQAGYRFLCFLPDGPERPAEKRPLIVFLHGVCPDEDLEKFKHFGPIGYALRNQGFPFIVVSPASSRGWSPATLNQMLQYLQMRFPVDPDRIYLTGYSSGAHVTWSMALAYPTRFAAIAPVAGAGNPREASLRLRRLPVWIFHGVKDDVVPVAYGRQMAEALQRAGGEVKTTFYEDRGHDTWALPYSNPELYDWFMTHRRADVTRPPATTIPTR